MKILLCDIYVRSSGHNKGFIESILRYYKKSTENEIYFLFNKHTLKLIPDLLNFQNVYLIEDIDTRQKFNNKLNNYFRINDFKIIKKYAEDLRIDKLIMLDLDKFQVAIFLIKFNFDVCGIYFRPYHRIKIIEKNIFKSFSNLIRFIKKFSLESLLLSKKKVIYLYILNDCKVVKKNPNHYKYLPDPIINYEPDKYFNLKSIYNIPIDSFKILVFGEVSWRKNIEILLKSLENCNIPSGVTLLIVGPASKASISKLKDLISNNNFFNKEKNHIIFHSEFVTDGQMEKIFSDIDIVYLVYKNFYGSSGLLGRAAKYNKPSIVPKYSLMEEITLQYNLGVVVSSVNFMDLIRGIEKIYYDKQTINGLEYVSDHSEESFVRLLLN